MPPPRVDLPQELYGSVIQFVSNRSDLVVLLYVSKAVHHEAKRVLYGSVDLAYNHLRIYAWFRMIASSPHLALLVQSLTFGIQSLRMPSVAYSWFEVIARGLRSLTNLKEYASSSHCSIMLKQAHRLNLKKKGTRSISRYAQILDETPFRLKTFRNHMFDFEPTIPFLTSQPDITTWYQCLAAEPSPQSSDPDLPLLPLLSDAAIPSWLLPTYHSRNITRLHTAMAYQIPDEEHHTLNTLVGYGRTLTALVLDRDVIDGCSKLEDFVTGLAECLPLLESIYLWHRGDLVG